MGKLIYITESQLNEIIGNGAYLNDTDSTNEYRFGGKEISANGVTGDYVDGDVENGEPVTTDKIAKQLTRQGTRGMGRAIPYGYGTNKLRESKKKVNDNLLSEANQDLTGKNNTFQISPKELKKLKERLLSYKGPENDKGVKRVKNIIENDNIIAITGGSTIKEVVEAFPKTNNVSFDMIANWFSKLGENLIIEFVPKEDSQVKKLLKTRKDIFDWYDINTFEKCMCKYFKIVKKYHKNGKNFRSTWTAACGSES